nr:relaxase/mobilization nuclease domain-containing protein [Escherichia coli]
MIVKFHARGKGGGSGPVDYLLGRERNREGATVLQGNPEEVRELIDATPFAKKYTSGVLSFAEKELPPGGREKVMASFERVLMPGLEKNQYSILWVEHQDKGRLELNFVIPNMELQTGKRLQPYYDRADRPRIDAWQTLVNHHYGLHDPNAPENRRTLTLSDNLPETKQAIAEGVTRGIDALYHAGEIKGRQDVIQALTEAGLEVVRVTRSSISIADPNGGRNIRLKSEAVTSNETKIRDAIALFTASTEKSLEKHREGVKEAMMQHRKDVLKLAGNTGMMLLGIVFLLFTASGGTLWYLGGRIQANLEEIRIQEETLQKLNAKTWGVEFVQDGRRKFLVLPYGKSATVIPYQGKDWVQLTE